MVDVPTPGEVGEDAEQGNESPSLGDAARAGRDPVVSEGADVPDPESTQAREG